MNDRIQRFPGPGPKQSCIRCMRGGVTTFFVGYGDGEWNAGILMAVINLTDDEAIHTVEAMRAEHGTAWDDRHPFFIRLCADCAAKGKVTPTLYEWDEIQQHMVTGAALEGYNQTDEVMADYERWQHER